MNRKELSAYLAGCQVSEMMAYADLGDQGCVVIAPDGRKFRYSNEQLGEAAEARRALAHAPKPLAKAETERKPKPRQAATKNPSKAGTKRKPATKKATKPKSKTEPKPSAGTETDA